MDLPTFRVDFPEFADTSAYTDAQVSFYLGLAALRLAPGIWEEMYDYGVALYTAHCLALARLRQQTAARGLAPGMASGAVASKAVKDVSVSYDRDVTSIEGAGNYNLTDYGTMFYELVMIKGTGAIQLGFGTGLVDLASMGAGFGAQGFSGPYQ